MAIALNPFGVGLRQLDARATGIRYDDILRPMTSTSDANGLPYADDASALLLSDEPTIELVIRAQQGDRGAVEALLQRCLPSLKRWAHGRLPAIASNAPG